MSFDGRVLSGREARRKTRFGPTGRLRGAGWTRPMRKGREQRLLSYVEEQMTNTQTGLTPEQLVAVRKAIAEDETMKESE